MVGDLYCEKLRTLSTNWNLKFQRGETEGPYPRVEMALGFFPPATFVLCLDKSLVPAPQAVGGEKKQEIAAGEYPGDAKVPAAWGAGVWRMPLNLHMPATGSCASQVSGLLAGPGQGTASPGCQNSEVILWGPRTGGSM